MQTKNLIISLYIKIFLFSLLFSHAPTGLGETCKEPTFNKKYSKADVIFSGKVIHREKDLSNDLYQNDHESCGPKKAKIQIYHTWKGNLQKTVDVYSWDSCDSLGTYFDINEHYLVFATIQEQDTALLSDIGACYTSTLIEAMDSGIIDRLNRKTGKVSRFPSKDIIGKWESFNDNEDLPFKNIDKLTLHFKNQNRFTAYTFRDSGKTQYRGIYYTKEGDLYLLDEDGPQPFTYTLHNNLLTIKSMDGKIQYTLIKN